MKTEIKQKLFLTSPLRQILRINSGRKTQFITIVLCAILSFSFGEACFSQCTVVANAGKDTSICKNASVKLIASGGTSYLWNTGNSADTTVSITVSPAFSTTYTVTVSDGKCSAIASVKVNIITAVVTGTTTLCKNGGTVLTAFTSSKDISYKYKWSTGDTTTMITAKPSNIPDTTVYWVAVSKGSCSDTAFSTVKVTKVIAVIAAKDSVLCKGSSTTLIASGGSKYVWNTGNPADTTATLIINPLADTKYSVKVFNCICPDSAEASIKVNPLPLVSAGQDVSITSGSSITLAATGASTYLWKPTTGLSDAIAYNPTANPKTTTVYSVTGTDNNGCVSMDSVIVTLLDSVIVTSTLPCEVSVPNAFSPNGDEKNDLLKVHGDCIKEIAFSIYNRWGEEVFKATDLSSAMTKGWDGTYKQKPMNTAVFVYYLTATLSDGTAFTKKGNISLIR